MNTPSSFALNNRPFYANWYSTMAIMCSCRTIKINLWHVHYTKYVDWYKDLTEKGFEKAVGCYTI